MKNLKLLFVALLAVISVSSCMKDNNDYEDIDYEKIKARRDSTLKAQADEIEAYAKANATNSDSLKFNDTTGVWYEIIPTTNTVDSTFEYVASGNNFLPVTASVKYKEKSFDGKYTKDVSTATRASIVSGYAPDAWLIAFYPSHINGDEYIGLLPKGLLKNVKIRLFTSSIWYYDNNDLKENGTVKLPKDSPLDVTIEVVDISR